jgi:tetratricopeptide (TPR) repeat protein
MRMEGVTHALANRPAEAEQCFRKALAGSHASLLCDQVSLLDLLGDALKDQGRYEEAGKCLQASIDMGDNGLGSARFDLAELLLAQGTEPLRALELIDEGMRIAKGRAAAKVEPSRLATRAWALALLGRRQEAEQAIERAVRVRRETLAALFAVTHLNVGMAAGDGPAREGHRAFPRRTRGGPRRQVWRARLAATQTAQRWGSVRETARAVCGDLWNCPAVATSSSQET